MCHARPLRLIASAAAALLACLLPLARAADDAKDAAKKKDAPKVLCVAPLAVRPGVKTTVRLRGAGLDAATDVRFPDAARDFQRDPVRHHLPGGEDPVRAARRFTSCLQDIAERRTMGRVLVVAHSTVIRLALCSLIGVELSRYRRLFPALGNCALTEISLDASDVALLEFNTPVDRKTP